MSSSMGAHTWDVITEGQASGALWLGYEVASRLAALGQRVRLFSDEMPLLARFVPGIAPDPALQSAGGMTLAQLARAQQAWPAESLIQVLGARVPSAYLDRLFHRPGGSRWLQLESFDGGRDTTSPLTALETHLECQSFLIQVGDPPLHAGYLRPRTAALTQRTTAQLAARSDGRMVIFVDVSAVRSIAPLLSLWRREPAVCCVYLPEEAQALLTQGPSCPADEPLGAPVSCRVIGVPTLSWAESEQWMQQADVVVSADAVHCLRVATLGVPLIPLQAPQNGDDTLQGWYSERAPAAVADCLSRLAQAQHAGVRLSCAWADYLALRPSVLAHAVGLAQHMAQAPDLTETMLEAMAPSLRRGGPVAAEVLDV